MHSPSPQKKENSHIINRGMHIRGTVLSLAISAALSAGAGVNYYYKFDEGIPRLVFVLLMLLLWLGSSVIVSVIISVCNNIALKKTLRKIGNNNPEAGQRTQLKLKEIEDYEYNPSDTTKVSKAFVNIPKNYQQYIDEAYQTSVDDSNPHQLKFQTTEDDQPLSQNSENTDAEFIKKRLLEKETRILKVIDINVEKNSNHMYDFSAKIFVLAETLTAAAEIVDSANTILECEFNMKDTKLIPIISKQSLSPVM